MRITQHITNNDVLGAPPGVDHEACTPAPITRVLYTADNQPAVFTFWRPTPEEVAVLVAGGLVAVSVWGTSMPPMYVTAKAEDDRSLP